MVKVKLILINFINWIKFNKKNFFILLINMSLVTAVIIYLFSFNNNLLHSNEPSIRKLTYGRTYTIIGEMVSDEVYDTMNILLNNDQLPEIEFAYFSGMVDIGNKKGKVTAVKFFKDELIGYYYDEKYDINDSGMVALATDNYVNVLYGTNINQDTKNININGKNYVVEYTSEQFTDSMEIMSGIVLVRMSYDDFVSNINPISEVIIIFEKRLDDVQEKIFRNKIKHLNSREVIVQPKETTDQKNYKIEMIIDTAMLLVTLLCLIKIYEYIVNKRKMEFIVYRMYGAKKTFVVNILLIEIFSMTASSFLAGTILFFLITNITSSIKYIHFDVITLIKAFIILIICMLVVAIRLIIKLNRGNMIDLKKEAMLK